MNKEPIGLYIFRFVCGFGMLAFMAMLYWSSLIVEERLSSINSSLEHIKNDLFFLRSDAGRINRQQSERQETLTNTPGEKQSANLLSEDPFYATTLPKLLGADFSPQGTFRNDTIGLPHNLHPFSNFIEISQWQNLCTGALASLHFGKYEQFAPNFALRIEERPRGNVENGEFWVFLRKDAFWQPLNQGLFPSGISLSEHFLQRHPVTSRDFKFYWDALMNPYVQEPGAVAARNYYGDIEEIEIVDDYTFVVRWKTHSHKAPDGTVSEKVKYAARSLTCSMIPLSFFVYAYFADGTKIITDDSAKDSYRYNSSWAQNFSDHWAKNIIASCGPWQFEGMTDREIRFKRNREFFKPLMALGNEMVVEFKNSAEAAWQDFKSNRIDYYNMPPDQLAELDYFLSSSRYQQQEAEGQKIETLDFVANSFAYIGWNQAKPFFSSKKVRKAMTMAIDRKRFIEQNLNGRGVEIACPFSPSSNAYNHSMKPWPYDLHMARQLLEEEGWYDSNGDGTIDKLVNGKMTAFQFTLTYYIKNNISKEICEYISTALKEVGIECTINGVDIADMTAIFDDKSFDAICFGWALGTPPEDPRQLWHSAGAYEKGSSNAVGFANKDIDAIIDALDFEYDEKKRQQLFFRFCEIWHEEAPYTLMFAPKTTMLYRSYLQNVFIPARKQDLVPGAVVEQPVSSIFWLKL